MVEKMKSDGSCCDLFTKIRWSKAAIERRKVTKIIQGFVVPKPRLASLFDRDHRKQAVPNTASDDATDTTSLRKCKRTVKELKERSVLICDELLD
jgi:hypothetical protein